MEPIISYFAEIPASHRALLLAGGIAFFWLLEGVIPLFSFNYRRLRHAGINIFFTLTTIIVNFAMAFLLLMAAEWTVERNFGVLNWLPLTNLWCYAITGLLLLDLIGAWLAHYVQHKIKWMWRFHLIHHSDMWIDTTSANRHHPGESIIRFGFTILAVVLAGSPMWLVFLYQSLSVISAQFSHANISLPPILDRIVSFIFVSPDMHKVHHHYKLPYTDSNYGNIFSIWDRLFGTFSTMKRNEIVYGIDSCMEPRKNNHLKSLLLLPFWQSPEDDRNMSE